MDRVSVQAVQSPFASLILSNLPSFGALEGGSAVAMFFQGIATLQAWNYYRSFPKDPLFVKTLVAVVYVLDLFHSILFIQVTYHYTINGLVGVITKGDVLGLSKIPWTLEASLIVVAAILITVEAYFCFRILRITGSLALALGCFGLSTVRFGINIALTITSTRDGTSFVVNTFDFKWQTITELAVGTTTDICVASCICIGLLRCRTGFRHTDHIVVRLVMYTLGNGIAASIMSVGALIAYVTKPTQYVWIAFFGVISKIFSNSLLASLNQRGAEQLAPAPQTFGAVSTHLNFSSQHGHETLELDFAHMRTVKPKVPDDALA
ncbi:hypothetical protein EXIGLDRAFT_829420 [Exidia glandulosa HHB12029]|uniref:DUF6534 domain-containing protein n=1 Tax=Exidia glandulosa HHB12029 TaxID=1314781 RepID=A0A165PI23_EXIGL|nr:hypothetical protein EXIGLDRAFT_829420 [Exidia glandulosa HHB12029]